MFLAAKIGTFSEISKIFRIFLHFVQNIHYLFRKEKILEECGVAMAASQKNPNKFGFSFDLHYLCILKDAKLLASGY